jgi:dihydrolipoamide dehydrogenase
MPKKHYDLIVIGSGAGSKVAYHAAYTLGWKVAIVEEAEMGGTCLNHGCIPSKILIHTAELMESIKRSKEFGITAKVEKIDFRAIMKRASSYVDPKSKNFAKQLKKDKKIDLYQHHGEFLDEHTLKVGRKQITGKQFLIAAGARPMVPPIEGINETPYITSKEALRLKKLPKSMIIVGGGYISAELGNFYSQLGTKVSVIESSETLISHEDFDIAQSFTQQLSKHIKLQLNARAVSVKKTKTGVAVTVETKNERKKTLKAEVLFMATGVRPNTDSLKAHHAGVQLDEKGFVKVNKYLQSSQKHIWALGDINGQQLFRHAANYEADILKHNLTAKKRKSVDYRTMPHAIFSSPEIAGVGKTEQDLIREKKKYQVKSFEYSNTAKGKAIEEHQGFVKYLLGEKNQILGCHIIGPHASILIHEVIVAMNSTGSKADLIEKSIHIHPSLNEVVWWALTKNN